MSDRHLERETSKYLSSEYREPVGPFDVEIYTGNKVNGGWDAWALDREEYQEAVSEAQMLEDHGFPWRITGADGVRYSPNLKRRRAA